MSIRRLVSALALGALLPMSAVAAQTPRVSPDETAIRAAVQGYIDGIMNKDSALLRRVFHADAVVSASLPRGEYRQPFPEWVRFTERAGAVAEPERYGNKIVSIDQHGTAAVAKTRLEWPQITHVDHLTLLKIGGEWRIVGKIWHQEPPARTP